MLNWAILGTGFISKEVAGAIKSSDGSRIAAIAGRNSQARADIQKKFQIDRAFNGYDAVFEDPDIDTVYIGLPNHMHHIMTVRAAENGKAVLSEKSLTTNMEDANILAKAVIDHGIFFVEGLMYLAHPIIRKFVDTLTDGRLGKLKAINGYYTASIADLVNQAGKGTLYNLGCYPVSLLQLTVQTMCGDGLFKARQISGHGNRSDMDGNICDAAATVRFDNGVLANLQSSDSYGMANSFEVIGDHGKLSFRSNPWLPSAGRNHLQWSGYDGSYEDLYVDDDHDAFYHQIKMVEEAVRRGETQAPRPSPRLCDSLEIMEFLTEWEASIQ